MECVATTKIRIPKNKVLLETMEEYSKAASIVASKAIEEQTTNKYDLHALTYKTIREQTLLNAQLVCSARNKAAETMKSVIKKHGYKKTPTFKKHLPIRYDKRSSSLKEQGTIASISTTKGRQEIVLDIPDCYKKYCDQKAWSYVGAELVLNKKEELYLHLLFKQQVEQPKFDKDKNTVVGVDLGINKIAVTSNNQFFNNTRVRTKKSAYRYLRRRLQSKDTRAAKKKLREISGREKRFMRGVNHEISKEITKELRPGDVVVLEDLTHIRRHRRGKKQNYWLNNWSFFELQQFIKYKAERKGATVVQNKEFTVFSSMQCSSCGCMKTRRNKGFFECPQCSLCLDADLNAARNLAQRYTRNNMQGCCKPASLGV